MKWESFVAGIVIILFLTVSGCAWHHSSYYGADYCSYYDRCSSYIYPQHYYDVYLPANYSINVRTKKFDLSIDSRYGYPYYFNYWGRRW